MIFYYFCNTFKTFYNPKIIIMKKISFLFVAVAMVGLVSLSSCKPKAAEPAAETTEAATEVVADTAAPVADTTAAAPVTEAK